MNTLTKWLQISIIVGVLMGSQSACSQPSADGKTTAPTKESVRKQWETRFAQIEVQQIAASPMPGLWEVHTTGGDVFYTDPQVNYVIEGALIDAKTRKNLTQERMDQMAFVKFADLPFDAAIKQVRGNGKRKVAIFEDPHCGYCKQFRKNIANVNDITIYTFTYPILSPDSAAKARAIWCEKDKVKAWDDWMLSGKAPANTNCETPVDKITEFGRKYRIRGTPTMFFADDTRIASALSAEKFLQALNAATK